MHASESTARLLYVGWLTSKMYLHNEGKRIIYTTSFSGKQRGKEPKMHS